MESTVSPSTPTARSTKRSLSKAPATCDAVVLP
jgi:hypothetical protein